MTLIPDYQKDKIMLFDFSKKQISIYNNDFELIKSIDNISKVVECFDVNSDDVNEIIAIRNNNLLIISNDLKQETLYNLGEYAENITIIGKVNSYYENGQTIFYFSTKMFVQHFKYEKNKISFLKYPLFIVLIFILFALFIFLIKINSRRLEKENIKLEQTILERTNEIREKNKVLISQKEEIHSQAEELKAQNEHLAELSNFKKTMTDTIIHDLKNPLNTILNQTSDRKIISSGKRMLNLIMNILYIEKYENTQFKLNCEIHSLKKIISEVTENFETYCEQKNNKIILLSDDFDIFADKDILIRVFENLLSNAIRFSDQNKNIEISAKEIEENKIMISVKNYGEAIPENKLETVFDKYSQAKISDSKNYKSSGLGLTYCKMAIEAHEQTIKAKNIENKGVEIQFTMKSKFKQSENQQIKTEIKDEILFSQTEIDYLQPFILKLKNLEIYKISEIIEILNHIENRTIEIKKWKTKLNTAIFSSNTELFNKLLESF